MDPLRDEDEWDYGFEVFKGLLSGTDGFRELIEEWPIESLHSSHPHPHPPLSTSDPPGMDATLQERGMSLRDATDDLHRLVRKYLRKETGILQKVHRATAAFESDFESDMEKFFQTRKQRKRQSSNLSHIKRDRSPHSSSNFGSESPLQLNDEEMSGPTSKSHRLPSMAYAGDLSDCHALSGIEELCQRYPRELVEGVASLAKRFPSFFEVIKDIGAKKDCLTDIHVSHAPIFEEKEWFVGDDRPMPLDPFPTLDAIGDIPCPSNHSFGPPQRSELDSSLSGPLGKIGGFEPDDDPRDLFPF
eukprot:TRINITY_DN985_c0_g1_i1.p1 TRINITY_DN985_c0_g1~~TRINITY_DN985_c0_g1_i1.p1  ORF type:complete len:302 (-),score=76.05 TRINITY_DN985_c0_g1_i1:56-961(-)